MARKKSKEVGKINQTGSKKRRSKKSKGSNKSSYKRQPKARTKAQKRKTKQPQFKKHTLAFEKKYDTYVPSQLEDIEIAALRAEYTRLRDIGQKRVKRLGESAYTNSEAYQRHKEGFKTLKQISSEKELREELAELSRFVNSASSTIRGQDQMLRQRIQTLRSKGYMIPTDKAGALAYFKWLDYCQDKHGLDFHYHVSEAERRSVWFDDRIKDLLSKEEFDEAWQMMKEIQSEYQEAADVTEKEEKDFTDFEEL